MSALTERRRPPHAHRFRAMGCTVEVVSAGGADEAAEASAVAEREIGRLERLLSRFDPRSELSRLNREGSLHAGPELVEVVGLALAARATTAGLFDPTVHDAVVAAGYDRSFDQIDPDREPAGARAHCAGEIHVDGATGRIVLEAGTRLDLGGIAKGYAVDRACALLAGAEAPCLVNAGGDLAVTDLLDGGPWPVAIETGKGPLVLGLREGAIATSGRDVRRFGTASHHLIDPRLGRPAAVDLLRVTACAPTTVDAEVLAKSLFLRGLDEATMVADRDGIDAVLVAVDGRTVRTGGLR